MKTALIALREAAGKEPDRLGIDHLRIPLRELCAAARRDGVLPESMVVALKVEMEDWTMFATLPRPSRDGVHRSIVSFAITMYFADADAEERKIGKELPADLRRSSIEAPRTSD